MTNIYFSDFWTALPSPFATKNRIPGVPPVTPRKGLLGILGRSVGV